MSRVLILALGLAALGHAQDQVYRKDADGPTPIRAKADVRSERISTLHPDEVYKVSSVLEVGNTTWLRLDAENWVDGAGELWDRRSAVLIRSE